MKKNAFTLIELLAVIVILAIIALIATISVNSTISQTKDSLCETQIIRVEEAAKSYYVKEGINVDSTYLCVSVSKLIEDGYIEGNSVLDPKTKEALNGSVKITYVSNQYSYEYQENSCEHLAQENITAVKSPTSGTVPEADSNGNIKLGSEFKIKVNDTIGELTFFVLSNEGNYVNLIAQKNIASDGTLTGAKQNFGWYITGTPTKENSDNRYGPQSAYTILSKATNSWTNIPIIENFNYLDEGNQSNSSNGYQSIVTELDETTGNYITTITPNSSVSTTLATYKNMRARLPKYNEVTQSEIGCTSTIGSCPLWMVDYLKPSSYVEGGTSDDSYSSGYVLLSSIVGSSSIETTYIQVITNEAQHYFTYAADVNYNIRPVITLLKSDLLKAMQ